MPLFMGMKTTSLHKLLEETNEAYYWMGFIMADGTINKNHELKVTLAAKDRPHLVRLQNYLSIDRIFDGSNDGYPNCKISASNKPVIDEIRKKYGIVSNKTENPPSLDWLTTKGDLFLSFICGFIDGDGSIGRLQNRMDFHLRIKCHGSWLNNVSIMNDFIYTHLKIAHERGRPKLNNQGYAELCIGNTQTLKQLKTAILKLGLPLLVRKWDKIDLSYIGKYEKSRVDEDKIRTMLEENRSNGFIAKAMGLSQSGVTLIIKRLGYIRVWQKIQQST